MAADFFLHPSSIVDSPCEIGKNTYVWHFCHIMSGCRIGPDCSFGQNVFIARNVVIGRNCRLQNNVSIFEGVTLEDYVFCGPSCVFTNVKCPRAEFPTNSVYQKTLVSRGASIGANATIVCGIKIGKYALVGAGAVVTRDVPQYGLAIGNPAKVKDYVGRHGARLEKVSKDILRCPVSNWKYEFADPTTLECIDYDEDKPLLRS